MIFPQILALLLLSSNSVQASTRAGGRYFEVSNRYIQGPPQVSYHNGLDVNTANALQPKHSGRANGDVNNGYFLGDAGVDHKPIIRPKLDISYTGILRRANQRPLLGKTGKFLVGAARRIPLPGRSRVIRDDDRVRKALSDRPLPKGHYAFFRVWPEKDTDGHPKLNALTRDIGGHHFALVVGTVDGFDIQAWMNQMLFKTLQIIDPNGEGQAVRSDFRPYNPRPAPRDRSYLKFIGKVPEVDGDTLREKGEKSLNGRTYDLKSNNCKQYVDKLLSLIQ
ncbi:hypothetical protein MMC10_009261 [Thelotrema lepadinum]|nr:hypothetical protein [Thelotrema lepadinum]